MIQLQTFVKILDNSGIKQVRCIRVEKKHAKCIGYPGDIFLGVITQIKKKNTSKLTFRKGDIVRVFVVSTKKESQHKSTGIYFNTLQENIGFVIQPTKKNKQQTLLPIASRFDSFFPKVFKKKFTNFISITSFFL